MQLSFLAPTPPAMSQFTDAFRRRMGDLMEGLCEGTGQETHFSPQANRLPCPVCGLPAPVRTEGSTTYYLSHRPKAPKAH